MSGEEKFKKMNIVLSINNDSEFKFIFSAKLSLFLVSIIFRTKPAGCRKIATVDALDAHQG